MRRRAALVASAIVVATGVVYWALQIRQAGPEGVLATVSANTLITTVAIVVMACLTGFGALGSSPELRAVALWSALPGLVVFGVLAGFSIGVLFLVAAVPTLVAGASALGETGVQRSVPVVAGALATLAWVGVAFLLIWLPSVT